MTKNNNLLGTEINLGQLIPLIVIIVAIVFGWANLKNAQIAQGEQIKAIRVVQDDTQRDIHSVIASQNEIILALAKRGIDVGASAPSGGTQAKLLASPTPVADTRPLTVNNFTQPQEKSQTPPAPQVSPAPQPSPLVTVPKVCIGGLCT